MSEDREVRRLFERALERPAAGREEWVRLAGADEARVARVLQLLRAHQRAERFLGGAGLSGPARGGSSPLPFDRLDEFEIIREVGRGGMGVVYLAHDTVLGREVAVKVLPALSALTPQHLERFRNEAMVMAKLSHPSIVSVFRFGADRGAHYIASEYISGTDLARELEDRVATRRSPWMPNEAAEMLAPIADALHHAHQRGVIHRDVKPSNILIDRRRRAYLTDFGLAKVVGDAALTRTGDLAGTCAYMSPEQAAALRAPVDHRSDVYSLGVVLYEMVSGVRPFRGETRDEILRAIGTGGARRLREVSSTASRDLEAVCERALERRPEDRYPNAAAFAADLRRLGIGEATMARPLGPMTRARRWVRRHRRAVVLATVSVCGVGIGVYSGHRAGADPRVAVRIESTPPGADVVARPFEPATGDYGAGAELGRTPLQARIQPGIYRFTLANGEGLVELARTIRRRDSGMSTPTIQAFIRPQSDVTAGMVLIPGGRCFVGMRPKPFADSSGAVLEPLLHPPYAFAPAIVDSFLIDPFEVTNEQYAAFVAATGHPAPGSWSRPHQLPRWDAMPVVGVTWLDARDFAEWAGKRLLTRTEWERAGRGTTGARYPWPDSVMRGVASIAELACVGRTPARAGAEEPDWFAEYCAKVPPVGSFPHDVTPDGVFDLVGSVEEWIETPDMRFVDGAIQVVDRGRWTKGGSWMDDVANSDLQSCLQAPEDLPVAYQSVGIRCGCSLKRW